MAMGTDAVNINQLHRPRSAMHSSKLHQTFSGVFCVAQSKVAEESGASRVYF